MFIVADDLSGAADTAVAFLNAACAVSVRWGADAVPSACAPDAVLAVDAETRRVPSAEARARTRDTVAALHALGGHSLYKKIDSTLRGHVAAELAATLDAWSPEAIAIVAPAFPEMRRTTIDARQWLDGRDTLGRRLDDVLAAGGIASGSVALAELRDGALPAALAHSHARGERAMVCDAATVDDLELVVRAGLRSAVPVVWVGSGGLARVLARADSTLIRGAVESAPPLQVRGPLVIVAGSANPATAAQVGALAGDARVTHMALCRAALEESSAAAAAARASLRQHLRDGRDVLISIDEPVAGEAPELVAGLAALLQPLGELAGGAVLTGGETALQVLSAWGCDGLRLVGEVEAGVPVSVTTGKRVIPVVTKAGGFGEVDALGRAVDRLREVRTQSGREAGR